MPRASSSRSVFQKILSAHIEDGEVVPGRTVALRIDHTLTRDSTGTLCWLEFETMGLERVATELAASYAETPPIGADDHAYLESVAARYGVHFSRPGNGPAHLVHLERFSAPGKTLLGDDPRLVALGGAGMLALPAPGLDVAVAMGGGPFHLRCPEVVQVLLRGKLRPLVTARDVALELLRRRSAKGGVGKVFEFSGPALKTLSVEERATIVLLCSALGATTAVFPSDDRTRSFLQQQRRIKAWRRLEADPDATFDDREDIDLGALEPMVAGPAPIGARPVREAAGAHVREAVVGGGGHASIRDLLGVAAVLKSRKVHGGSALFVAPGSRQVRRLAEETGVLAAIASAGGRLRDTVDADAAGGVFVRVAGEPGREAGLLCLVSAETAAASAVTGELTDPRTMKRVPRLVAPRRAALDDSLLVRASKDGAKVEVRRGPHLTPLPVQGPMPTDLTGRVLLKVGDDVSSALILPDDGDFFGRTANVLALAEIAFSGLRPDVARRSREWGGGCVVAGRGYGAGDRREYPALAMRLLGVRFVIARSFARTHLLDLVHFGVLPLLFLGGRDYESIASGDDLHVPEAAARLKVGRPVIVENRTSGRQIEVRYELSDREREILVDGGLLPFTRRRARKGKEAVAA